MSCTRTLTSILRDCDQNIGGIKKIWIAAYVENAATYSESSNTDKGIITAIKNIADYEKFEFKKNSCSMTSTLNVDSVNDINYVSTELVMQFNKMETSKRIAISSLVLADVNVIVRDSNDKYWFLGKDEPVSASAGAAQTGQAKTDGNFYSVTLLDESFTFPLEIKKEVMSTLDAE